MPTRAPLTAEVDGRYSDGTHSTLLPARTTQTLSGLRLTFWYYGFDAAISVLVET